MAERDIQRDIQLALAAVPGLSSWRVNVGTAWTGALAENRSDHGSRTVVLTGARPFTSGLPRGFCDIFGVTADGVPVFLEVKSGSGRTTPEQEAFLAAMKLKGARVGVARSVADALRIVRGEA